MERQRVLDGLILNTIAGSQLQGVNTEESDTDILGVCIEPPEQMVGILPGFEQYQFTSKATKETKSAPGDIEGTIYGLRKYVRLAAKGNPTILSVLFAQEHDQIIYRHELGRDLQEHAHLFHTKAAIKSFLGYASNQRDRISGLKRPRTNRPDLVEKHGYDCYLDDTEFLTADGWKLYDDIGSDESLATVNRDSGQVEFQRPLARVEKPYSGDILVSSTRYSEWAVTPNHRMWVSKMARGACGKNPRAYSESSSGPWGFRRADEVTKLDWYQQVVGAQQFNEYNVTDEQLKLLGAFISEGCYAKRRKDGSVSVISICQADGGRLHRIMATVASHFNFRAYRHVRNDAARKPATIWNCSDPETVAWLVSNTGGRYSHEKRLPSWCNKLSARQTGVLLDALIAGDGTKHRTGGWVYYTTSPGLAGDVQWLSMMAGRRANCRGPYARDGHRGCYQVLIHEEGDSMYSPFRGRDVRVIEVTDRRVVCFRVPNETLVTRRNGKVAMQGNCKYGYHAIRLATQGIEFAETGRITQPLAPEFRQQMLDMRAGKYSRDECAEWCTDLIHQLEQLKNTSDLPETPDIERITSKLCGWYGRAWCHYARDKNLAHNTRSCSLCGTIPDDPAVLATQGCGTCQET